MASNSDGTKSMTPKIYLESPRILLREMTEDDRANLKDLDSDSEVMRYLSNGVPSDDDKVNLAITRTLMYYERFPNRFGLWAAILKDTNDFVGWFLLRPDRNNLENEKDLELGYRLKRKFWRQGYATEVSKLLIDKAFEQLGADTVWAKTMKKNVASWGAMKKLGMSFEKEYIETEFRGDDTLGVVYRLTKDEWLKTKK